MSIHTAELSWKPAEGDQFSTGRYTRVHQIAFDGGTTFLGSPAPVVVREPYASKAAVDPEEMFVASLASCHMLWFLDFARRAGLEILSYHDKAEGLLEKNADGRTAITRVTLRPEVEIRGDRAKLAEIHRQAHDACFIANSVKSEVIVAPQN
ncbi:organic hydroperoxide reductase OsmC/OhrA [Mesorhizobium soli]|uniref:OsmC family protein n=1 Tax=Pseudaminobacter soli (ex Li et al. 2025) TaxID=1295366 RepID=UPI002476AF67|nr:OsmC family protein [Mesorhizobium soli]MDH6230460.1 organic hydroperoxide reductase OsmC/OhrA [Mesorhizobium soli]